ncbi:MAG: fructose-1,6-bisphosphatase [Peptoanaerobacter stomatis]|uniref:fructose-1,6-bisphosphatase n=1 Tax=Peptoanaerobacter stomatis TaxID=796937 RepID=UPI003F9F04BC
MITISNEELRQNIKYLELLSTSYPNITSAVEEVVNLKAILNLPKGTEHFLTDIHGEAEAFNHVMQNASGAIRRKVYEELGSTVSIEDLEELTTLIYYPKEKLELIKKKKDERLLDNWYELTIYRLVRVTRAASSKYTRSKVRKTLPKDFAYIMEELLQEDEHRFNKKEYYTQIIKSLVEYERADLFIIQISQVIKNLTIDHLHIIGDIYDRGPAPHEVMDTLMSQKNLDIQWGNHDILWMGAAAGSQVCVANAVRIALRYANNDVIEEGYGINLLPLATFASKVYKDDECAKFMPKESVQKPFDIDEKLLAKMHKAISIIQFKLEEDVIRKNPSYEMKKRKILNTIDLKDCSIEIEGVRYKLNDSSFPTIEPKNPIKLTNEEKNVIEAITNNFIHSEKLTRHIRFLYAKGSMYCTYNNNLLFHACILLNEDGSFKKKKINGEYYKGKALMDKYDQMAREAYFSKDSSKTSPDFLWFLWCNEDSTLFGKDKMTTFERYFIDDKATHKETLSPYYKLMGKDDGTLAVQILEEFGLDSKDSHIINGHTPVKLSKGERPIKAGGRQLVIDGGFSKAYQKTTGIAGYTLTYNSYGLTLISHNPFESVEKVLKEGFDIKSTKQVIETVTERKRVGDTDTGKTIMDKIYNLEMLISSYKKGIIKQKD